MKYYYYWFCVNYQIRQDNFLVISFKYVKLDPVHVSFVLILTPKAVNVKFYQMNFLLYRKSKNYFGFET